MSEAALTVKSSEGPLDGGAIHCVCPAGGMRMGRTSMLDSPCVMLILDLSSCYDPAKIMDEL